MRPEHPHQRLQQRLGSRHELCVYGAGGLLALSGAGWLVCHYLLRAAGPGPQPLEVWWLRLHGAALLAFLVVVGTVMPVHMLYGWRRRMNRGSGIALLLLLGLLALSGYGLYYLVNDEWRAWTGVVHWITGLAAVGLLGLHALLGKRVARRQSVHHRLEPDALRPAGFKHRGGHR
ncbi:MAG TPA: hypothetical protein VMC02_03050 [Steroidobacteraceae bacterium]|nr:hypothetical protein [Steroidobacteraceae bacterium]